VLGELSSSGLYCDQIVASDKRGGETWDREQQQSITVIRDMQDIRLARQPRESKWKQDQLLDVGNPLCKGTILQPLTEC
jgi:hypothetical protein